MEAKKHKIDERQIYLGSAEVAVDNATAKYRTISETWHPREVFGEVFRVMKENGLTNLEDERSLELAAKVISEKLQPEFALGRRMAGLMLSRDSSVRDFAQLVVDHGISATALFACAAILRGEQNTRMAEEFSLRLMNELKNSYAVTGKKGGDKANAEFRAMRAKVYVWLLEHYQKYKDRKALDEAATEIEKQKVVVGRSWRKIREDITEYGKLNQDEVQRYIAENL